MSLLNPYEPTGKSAFNTATSFQLSEYTRFQAHRDENGIEIDPNYANDKKTGYIQEHDLSKRYWEGGKNK